MQAVIFGLQLCGAFFHAAADFDIVSEFLDLSGYNGYPSFYRQDLSLILFTIAALQLVPQLIPVTLEISDRFLSPVLITLQIFIGLDPVFSEKPGLSIQLV